MSGVTTHVLDTSRGKPAAGMGVVLEHASAGEWQRVGSGETATDGRAANLAPAGTTLSAGTYRLVFDTGAYFQALGVTGFYPEVVIVFEVRDPADHYHVPLLLSPYGYSTYRGS
jgi:5-hydroxyisourate hydrolase